MIKKVLFGILFFVIGFGIASLLDSFFRHTIQDLFQWITNNGIQFNGKDFYLFGNPIYNISFGLASLVFSIANKEVKISKTLRNAFLLILLFTVTLIGICAIDANLKIIECTACEDGIRRLGHSEINYGLILAISIIISIIPSLILLIRNWKKPAHNNGYKK